MIKSIKLDGDVYEYHDVQCQLTFGTHATLYISFDLSVNPNYKSKLISLYESDKNFDIISNKFTSKSNRIKFFDLDNNKQILNITIKADYLETIPQDKRRDTIIEDLLRFNIM
jgi:hypothetical protein